MMWRRMPAMCANCPFRTDGNAIELRPGRVEGIRAAVTLGKDFPCHKTTYGEAPEVLFCAGAWKLRMETCGDREAVGRALEYLLSARDVFPL